MTGDATTTPIRQVGRYQLRSVLGEGGMGVVYHGVDPDGWSVAVKLLRPHVAGDQEGRDRFASEVRAMRRVRGPRVAEVLDADVTAATPYVVTSYVAGPPLYRVVADHGPLAGPALVQLGCGLAEALQAIHGAGVVHRDLKPGNVLMVHGAPVVIDFGIAQIADESRLTSTGLLVGTPGYLAPEVLEGQPATWSSDIHSWAAAMAFAATGRPPFGRGPFEAVAYRVTSGRADLAGVPDWLVPVLRLAMSRDPRRRPRPAELSSLVSQPGVARAVPADNPAPGMPPVAAPQGTRQYTSAAPAQQLPAQQRRPVQNRPQRPPPPPLRRARPWLTLLLLLVFAAAGAGAPLVTIGLLCLASMVARTIDRQGLFLTERWARRGRTRSDIMVALWALPLHAARSSLFAVITVPLASIGALALVVLIALFAPPVLQVTNTHVLAGILVGATALLAWWGLEGDGLRSGTRRVLSTVSGPRPVALVAALVFTALVITLLVEAASGPVQWWPFDGGPGSFVGGIVSWLRQHQFFA